MPEGFIKPKLVLRTGSHTTTVNTYVSVPDDESGAAYFRVKGYQNKIAALVCTDNNLVYDIDGALDDGAGAPSDWIDLVDDTDINVGNTKYPSTEPWDFLRVQVKPKVADAHGKLDVKIRGSTL